MINLLPIEVKEARSYGRKNRTLAKWCLAALCATIGIIAIAGGGYFFLTRAETSASNNKDAAAARLTSEKLDTVEKDFSNFSGNLKTVIQILSRQILFSDLVQQIGSVLPAGASLNSVSITDKDNALNLDFSVTSPDVAPTLQLNLENEKNALFEKADIIQVACQTNADTGKQTCGVQVRALFRKDAKFLFLNSVSGAK